MNPRTEQTAQGSKSGELPSGSYDRPELNDSWFDRRTASRKARAEPASARAVVIDPLADDWFR
jgi:hypothetical protein